MEIIKLAEKNDTLRWLKRIVHIDEIYGEKISRFDLREIAMEMLHVNIRDLLNKSCYYYCSGSDITPIVAFEEFIHSYIYCDNCHLQNFDTALSILKNKLRNKGFYEIQKLNIDSNFLNFYDFKNNLIPSHIILFSPIPKGEFSIWNKGNHLYSLLYLCWDDICALKYLYIENAIFPIAICNCNPEDGNIVPKNITITEKYLPKYIIGHCGMISDKFEEIGKVEYFGDYAENSRVYINPDLK